MNRQQQDFLERLALRIPRLFDAIAQGNVKSEYIIGVRYIGARHVRLKLVAEVVDPGANPLATHGQMRSGTQSALRSVDMSVLSVGSGGNPAGAIEPQGSFGSSDAISSKNDSETDPESSPGPSPGPASRRRRSRKR